MANLFRIDRKKPLIYYSSSPVKEVYLNGTYLYRHEGTVTYKIDTDVTKTATVEYGQSVLSPSFTPAKTDWTFVGWRADTNANSTILTSQTMGTTNITLYAVFQQTITGTFKSYNKTATATGIRYYNNGTVANATLTAPTGASYSGWTWRGWSKANVTTGNAAVGYANGAEITGVSANATYYGLYSTTITGTFKSYNKTATATGTKYWNAADKTVNATLTAPTGATYSGWTWRGWSAAGTTTGNASVKYANGAEITGVSANSTYYGLYSATVTVKYNKNGGSGTTSNSTGTKYWNAYGNTTGASITLRSCGFTYSGKSFSKWAKGSTSGTQYDAGTAVTLTADTTFYAIWKTDSKSFSGSLSNWSGTSSSKESDYIGSGYSTFSITIKATKCNPDNGNDPVEDGLGTSAWGDVSIIGSNGTVTDVVGKFFDEQSGSASGNLSTYGGKFKVHATGYAGKVSWSGTLKG